LGQLYAAKGMDKRSAEAFAKAVQLDPLGEVTRKTDVRRAADIYGADPAADLELGKKLQREGKTDEAIDVLERAVAQDPKNGPAHYYLGLCYAEKKEGAKAVVELEEYLKLEPKAENRNEVAAQIAKLRK
jgi:cytochrome c-type biogenesis protein CcmH/NrfG